MLSRVAENLYWIGRYVERAESLARLLEDAHSMTLEAGADGAEPLDSALRMLSAAEAFATIDTTYSAGAEHRHAILCFLTFDRTSAVSILASVAQARENARGTQEAVPGEVWSQLNKLHLFLNSPRAQARFDASPARFLWRLRREAVLFAALADGTMPRTEAYHFLQIGRHLERVDMLSRELNVHCVAREPVLARAAEPEGSAAHWVSLLRSVSAHEAYLQQAHGRVEPVAVVRYLLLSPEFPRSMQFGVARCLESLRCVAGGGPHALPAERHLGKLDTDLRYMDVEQQFPDGIARFLADVQTACAAVARDVQRAFFST